MSDNDWETARQARDQLLERWGRHPGVRMIDIGLDDDGQETVVLRVHLEPGAGPIASLPREIAGLPVRVVFADYQPE